MGVTLELSYHTLLLKFKEKQWVRDKNQLFYAFAGSGGI